MYPIAAIAGDKLKISVSWFGGEDGYQPCFLALWTPHRPATTQTTQRYGLRTFRTPINPTSPRYGPELTSYRTSAPRWFLIWLSRLAACSHKR